MGVGRHPPSALSENRCALIASIDEVDSAGSPSSLDGGGNEKCFRRSSLEAAALLTRWWLGLKVLGPTALTCFYLPGIAHAHHQFVRSGIRSCSMWFDHPIRACRSRLCVAREVFRQCSRGAAMPDTDQRHALQAALRGLSPLLRRAALLRRFCGRACHSLGCWRRLHDGCSSMAVLPRRSRRRRLSVV